LGYGNYPVRKEGVFRIEGFEFDENREGAVGEPGLPKFSHLAFTCFQVPAPPEWFVLVYPLRGPNYANTNQVLMVLLDTFSDVTDVFSNCNNWVHLCESELQD